MDLSSFEPIHIQVIVNKPESTSSLASLTYSYFELSSGLVHKNLIESYRACEESSRAFFKIYSPVYFQVLAAFCASPIIWSGYLIKLYYRLFKPLTASSIQSQNGLEI